MTLIPFEYNDQPVRVIEIDGEPWFVLADLCKVLGMTRSAAQVSERLEDGVRQTYPITDSLGRTQQATIVSEAGMYEVVIRSDKPEAAAFRRWITHEVLPAIRKHGSYGIQRQLTPDEIVAQALQITNERVKALAATVTSASCPKTSPTTWKEAPTMLPPENAVPLPHRPAYLVAPDGRVWSHKTERFLAETGYPGSSAGRRVRIGHLAYRVRDLVSVLHGSTMAYEDRLDAERDDEA